jgi:hypothetical protein
MLGLLSDLVLWGFYALFQTVAAIREKTVGFLASLTRKKIRGRFGSMPVLCRFYAGSMKSGKIWLI